MKLSELQAHVENLIAKHGADSHCAAWVYSKDNIIVQGEYIHTESSTSNDDGESVTPDAELVAAIFQHVSTLSHIQEYILDAIEETANFKFAQQLDSQDPEFQENVNRFIYSD